MDVSFFRFIGPLVANALQGVRFDTVFSPAPGFWTLAFTPPASLCRFLLIRAHPRTGILFLSPIKPANPLSPPARAMWLRKRLRGRKVAGAVTDWPQRRLALELSSGEGRFLLIAMEDDPVVLERLPDDFGHAPDWKSPDEALTDKACPRSLRAALMRAQANDRATLLEAFLAGRPSGFFLPSAVTGGDSEASGPLPWPLPGVSERFESALAAASAYSQSVFFGALAPSAENPGRVQAKKDRLLAHLDADQKRLESLTRQRFFGEAIAANLSILGSRSKTGPRVLVHPEQGALIVPFDPSLTVLENMERFFRKAAKGRRGLGHVERLRHGAQAGELPFSGREGQNYGKIRQESGISGRKWNLPLHRFRSSDGFLILRGKDSAANHKLLSEAASPFDYWFHAAGGPGAHVILKRDHPGQDVPERSLREAAILAGLASWRAKDAKAEVIWTLCSQVRKTKGAPLGQVKLDEAETLLVELDPALEERLRLTTAQRS